MTPLELGLTLVGVVVVSFLLVFLLVVMIGSNLGRNQSTQSTHNRSGVSWKVGWFDLTFLRRYRLLILLGVLVLTWFYGSTMLNWLQNPTVPLPTDQGVRQVAKTPSIATWVFAFGMLVAVVISYFLFDPAKKFWAYLATLVLLGFVVFTSTFGPLAPGFLATAEERLNVFNRGYIGERGIHPEAKKAMVTSNSTIKDVAVSSNRPSFVLQHVDCDTIADTAKKSACHLLQTTNEAVEQQARHTELLQQRQRLARAAGVRGTGLRQDPFQLEKGDEINDVRFGDKTVWVWLAEPCIKVRSDAHLEVEPRSNSRLFGLRLQKGEPDIAYGIWSPRHLHSSHSSCRP